VSAALAVSLGSASSSEEVSAWTTALSSVTEAASRGAPSVKSPLEHARSEVQQAMRRVVRMASSLDTSGAVAGFGRPIL
jgi:hypothetical protein